MSSDILMGFHGHSAMGHRFVDECDDYWPLEMVWSGVLS